ncbi:hypothetical protein [Candidatus Cetobacterium colombiensis]|uniref:Outer membrane protein beta-barrel domain-containing protein n=1 Tax=Candidatus Cetobacterium colombiensis TaxID=3073100 RepID=A0ABU4WBP7_9FUSO|nr:hypothetical protein [Candidatus Cetobacterium colombiensis]MDX8335903.1 hypothetical protein [Candidatus Cetobacterium colombiensis]
MKRTTGLLFLLPQLVLAQDYWRGIPYPMNRWGISALGVSQTEKGKISNIDINIKKIPLGNIEADLEIINPESIKVKAEVKGVKVDYFVLPFLSVYGIYGQLKADVDMRAGSPQIGIPGNGWLGEAFEGMANSYLEKVKLNGKVKTEGDIYGAGAVLAGEYENVFGMLQYTYTEIHMKGGLAKKKAEVSNARLGYSFKPKDTFVTNITPYFGATYQLMGTQVKAGIGDLNATIDLELDEISPAAGIFFQLSNNVTLMVETTWGTKDSVAIDIGYRF